MNSRSFSGDSESFKLLMCNWRRVAAHVHESSMVLRDSKVSDSIESISNETKLGKLSTTKANSWSVANGNDNDDSVGGRQAKIGSKDGAEVGLIEKDDNDWSCALSSNAMTKSWCASNNAFHAELTSRVLNWSQFSIFGKEEVWNYLHKLRISKRDQINFLMSFGNSSNSKSDSAING